jgi:DNA repair photolyase
MEVGFTITSLQDIPFRQPYAPGNTNRIQALKKAHELAIKTFASIEHWIPDVTYPQLIIEKLRDFVDRFIIGSMQYHGVPRAFYAERLAP